MKYESTWNCPNCGGFTSAGATGWVEHSKVAHLKSCPGKFCTATVLPYWNEILQCTSEICHHSLPCFLHTKKGKAQEGYHKREIPRGKFGEVSKIREELEELEDAMEQGNKIMVGCELSDLYGALREVAKNYGLRMFDLEKMADVSALVFTSGHRKPRD